MCWVTCAKKLWRDGAKLQVIDFVLDPPNFHLARVN